MRHLRRTNLKAVTKALATNLTTRERARAALPQANLSADDTILDAQIATVSQEICARLRTRATLDSRSTLAVERVQEKITFNRYTNTFYLSRAPIIFTAGAPLIHFLMLNDDILLNTELEVMSADGQVRFVSDDGNPYPVYGDAVIEYTAGYNLPSTATADRHADAPDLPGAIETAAWSVMKGIAMTASRDPTIRSESSDEVDAFTYFAEGGVAVAWREAEPFLEPYIRRFI